MNLLKKIKLYKIHVFQYSKRDGTKAALMENQISPNVKEIRSKKVIEISNKVHEEIGKTYIGKEVSVLVEEKEDGIYKGHTANYMYVAIDGESKEDLKNKIVNVKIADIKGEMLVGRNN